MQMSLSIPYNETRLRRTLQFLIRPLAKIARIRGAALIAIGGGLAVLKPGDTFAYVAILLGLWLVFGAGPIAVGRSMRRQPKTIKEDSQLELDDEWVTVRYPRLESRHRWTGIDRVIDTDEAWYLMTGRHQALTVPKDRMTPEQQAEFAAFVAGLRPAGQQPPEPASTEPASDLDRPAQTLGVRPPTPS